MGMHPTTMTRNDEQRAAELVDRPAPATRRVSADLALGLTLLGGVIVGRLLWAVTDGSILTALGTR
jgi:hypothetical protein